jgi:hypothetical protein
MFFYFFFLALSSPPVGTMAANGARSHTEKKRGSSTCTVLSSMGAADVPRTCKVELVFLLTFIIFIPFFLFYFFFKIFSPSLGKKKKKTLPISAL